MPSARATGRRVEWGLSAYWMSNAAPTLAPASRRSCPRRLTYLHVRRRNMGVAVEGRRSAGERLIGMGVDAERSARPYHEVGVLGCLEPSDPVLETQHPGRVQSDPRD